MSWAALRIAVVAGDSREQEIARLAAATGAEVRAFGMPWPEDGIAGVERAPDAAGALRGADYALFPIPGIAADGSLFAPAAPEPIVPTGELVGLLAEGAHVILGAADDGLRAAAAAHGVGLAEYEDDRELMLLRAPAIVEGALERAIAATDVTIHGAEVAVVGFGTIGKAMARALGLLGARVTVAARNRVQRAEAFSFGATPVDLDGLRERVPALAMVFSTVPAPVVDRELLELLPAPALVMDLAAPPGGVDLEAAARLGHSAIWARGLGARAPISVGASQWSGIRRRIEEIEAARPGGPRIAG